MRELNECKAEVFRRSEMRIKKRRKTRNRVLAFCIPLCLVVAVWSVMILPAMMPAGKSNNAYIAEDMFGNVNGTSAAYIQVEVSGIGNDLQSSIAETDATKVAQIFDTIQSAFAVTYEPEAEAENTGPFDDMLDEKDRFYSQSQSATSSGYRIVFTAVNGSRITYSLNGDKLTDESTKQEVTLSEEQYSELLTALGLVITWEEDTE